MGKGWEDGFALSASPHPLALGSTEQRDVLHLGETAAEHMTWPQSPVWDLTQENLSWHSDHSIRLQAGTQWVSLHASLGVKSGYNPLLPNRLKTLAQFHHQPQCWWPQWPRALSLQQI